MCWGWSLGRKNLLQQLCRINGLCCCSVAQSCPTLWPHWLEHARLTCPSPSPRACSNSCPFSQWCHPTVSSSDIPVFSCPQSFPALGSFLMSRFFATGGQSIGISALASVLPMDIQDWLPLVIPPLFSSSMLGTYWPGEFISVSHLLTFSYCSWGSQGKNAEVVFHSILQWAMLPNLKTWKKFISPQYFLLSSPKRWLFCCILESIS